MTLDDAIDCLIRKPETLNLMLREPGRSQRGLSRYLGVDVRGVNRLVNDGREMEAWVVDGIRGYLEESYRHRRGYSCSKSA